MKQGSLLWWLVHFGPPMSPPTPEIAGWKGVADGFKLLGVIVWIAWLVAGWLTP